MERRRDARSHGVVAQQRSLVSERAERAALGWAAVMLVAPLAGVTQRNYWLGWTSPGVSDAYSALNYKACIKPYFEMLKAEQNPMLGEETPFWEQQDLPEKFFEKVEKNPALKERMICLMEEALKN